MASTLEEALEIAAADRLPADGAAVVRAGRPRHGGRPRRGDAASATWRRPSTCRPERPILIDKFLENAIEAEADAIADGKDAFVPAVMEHIELAGVHSGDSACVIPPISIPQKHIDTIDEYTRKIAIELNVVGLMNIQYAICDDTVYVLEANPRASRTVPLVSKVCNIPMARIATQVMLGKKLAELELETQVDPALRRQGSGLPLQHVTPRSTRCWGRRCARPARCWAWPTPSAWPSTRPRRRPRPRLPLEGTVLITVADERQAGRARGGPALRRAGLPDQGHRRHARLPGRARHRGGAARRCARGGRTSSTPSSTARSSW